MRRVKVNKQNRIVSTTHVFFIENYNKCFNFWHVSQNVKNKYAIEKY